LKRVPRILVAGVGNVLHGDDGFGVAVAARLMRMQQLPPGVRVVETGIGGMSLIQEVMAGCEALLIVDACSRGGQPGQLYLLDVELPPLTHLDAHALRGYFADTHYATPDRALHMLAAIGRLPTRVGLLGCEPADAETLGIGLSAVVASAVVPATQRIREWAEAVVAQAG
jgi:hydrogenase maturation protease